LLHAGLFCWKPLFVRGPSCLRDLLVGLICKAGLFCWSNRSLLLKQDSTRLHDMTATRDLLLGLICKAGLFCWRVFCLLGSFAKDSTRLRNKTPQDSTWSKCVFSMCFPLLWSLVVESCWVLEIQKKRPPIYIYNTFTPCVLLNKTPQQDSTTSKTHRNTLFL